MGAWTRRALVALLLSAPAARAQAVRTVALLPLASGTLAVQARGDGMVVVAASESGDTATLTLAAPDVRAFADSTRKLAALRVPRRRRERVYKSLVTEPTTGAGLSFARHVTNGASVYRLYFARADLSGFPFDVARRELELFLGALRRGAAEASRLAAQADSVAPPP